MTDPDDAVRAARELAEHDRPLLVGVRHHSPACAAAIPPLLDAFGPEELLVELPAELEPWLPWLGHPDTEAPVALACVSEGGGDLGFYPFADFSPELAAVRWAVARGVPVRAIDHPFAARAPAREAPEEDDHEPRSAPSGLVRAVEAWAEAEGVEALWDRLVEAHAPGQTPEAIRRAALAFGWMLRADAVAGVGVPARDLAREATMRARIAAAPARSAAVVGAFHAPALLPAPMLGEARAADPPAPARGPAPVCSLIPYAFDLLDSRSGYPAGIRDPAWQERVWAAARTGEALEDVARDLVVRVARAVRADRHVAGVPDASEAVRMAIDLARLRGLPAPGRREVLESIESAIARGEPLGRGRVLARALDRVMVGQRRGKLASGTPRSGLVPHVAALFAELDLPRAIDTSPKRAGDRDLVWSLDPLRSPTDRRRHVALERMAIAGVPYGTRDDRPGGDAELVGSRWRVEWTPSTEAMLELAGVRGVTLEQAAEGALRAAERKLAAEGGVGASERVRLLEASAAAGLARLAAEHAAALGGRFLLEAGLADLTRAIAVVDRIALGHVPGLPPEWDGPPDVSSFTAPPELDRGALLSAAIRAVEGLLGSSRVEDARAIGDLVRARAGAEDPAESGRLGWAIDVLAEDGSPLMQGAGAAARVLLGRGTPADLGVRAGSWIDAGGAALADRFRGALVLAAPILEAEPAIVRPIVERVAALDDEGFLERLPGLRDGVDALSPAARARMLDAIAAELGLGDPSRGGGLDAPLDDAPEVLAAQAAADAAGARAALALGLDPLPEAEPLAAAAPPAKDVAAPIAAREGSAIAIADRLRLVFGRKRDELGPRALPMALALDELYGRGRGEGSRGELGGGGAGTEAPFPSIREWGKELGELFGDRVREEVLARAAGRGIGAAVLELDPDRVKPSVELLETVLALKGGLPEADLAHVRRMVARIVDELVRELATRVRPALAGLVTPRPSRRPTGPLDLRRTVAANLHTARDRAGGGFAIAPERMVWRTRTQRALDWHVVLVVDVSGSMEPSVIYSAVMAAILSAIPAVTVKFVAFNTRLLDLSDRVTDPLGLLLEVSVGGGTLIAPALRYARSLLKVPARSIVLVVTDFEEGESVPDVLAETRALVETGCKALGLAALDDAGKPRFHRGIAELVAGAGMPVAALTPTELARWIGEQIR